MKTTAFVLATSVIGSAFAADPAPDGGALAGKYPKAHPYELEKIVPPIPPGQDNDLTTVLDEVKDPTYETGGYAAKEFVYCNPYEWWPYGRWTGGGSDYSKDSQSNCAWSLGYFSAQKLGLTYTQLNAMNCTKANTILASDEATLKGNFPGSAQVCDGPGSCCKQFWGANFHAPDFRALHDRWDTRYNTYNCQWLNEPAYCQLLFWEVGWCQEQWYGEKAGMEGGRSVVTHCNNVAYYFLHNCKTFKAIGAKGIVEPTQIEPVPYIKKITAAEANMVLAIFYSIDRVCVPLSEAVPEERLAAAAAPTDAPAPGESPAPAATPPASTPPATPASDDSAASGFQPLFLFSGLAAVFSVVRAL